MIRLLTKGLRYLSLLPLVFVLTCAQQPGSVSPERFCDAFVKAACAWQRRCAPTADESTCEKGYLQPCTESLSPEMLASIRRGEIAYDARVVASWLATLRKRGCGSDEIFLAPEPLFRPLAETKESEG